VEARVGRRFQVLSLVSVVTIFSLVVLGGVVRLTESGLGCPDWPLCHGKVIPPLDTATLIEYSHRLVASLVGVLVVATGVVVWRSYRGRPWLVAPATLGVVLLVFQVLLGGFTVLRDLPGEIVMAHLATAQLLLASALVVCLVALNEATAGAPGATGDWKGRRIPVLTLAALAAVYAVLLTGSYVTVSGATTACGKWWPLCQGGLLPEGQHAAMHMVHRLMGLLAAGLVAAVVAAAWLRRGDGRWIGWAAVVVGAAFLAQVLVGAGIVFGDFALAARLAHLAMASLVWTALATLALLLYAPWLPRAGGGGA
jgi:heme A synthase